MDRPSDELFPGAGLAKNKHCGVRRCDYLDVFERGFERWALPDDLLAVTDPVCGKELPAPRPSFRFRNPVIIDGTPARGHDFLQSFPEYSAP